LVFQSWASDILAGDFNHASDVFILNLLYATSSTVGQAPAISWPAAPGRTYQVQYKNTLDEANWQDASGTITITGNRGSFTDASPASGQRFYRVSGF
jgi:hypothetical protein